VCPLDTIALCLADGALAQSLVRIAIKDQKDATKLGLEYLQESSRKNALDILLEERDGEYQTALADFNVGEYANTCTILTADIRADLCSKCGLYRSKGALKRTVRYQ
jgi:hypothetical protein